MIKTAFLKFDKLLGETPKAYLIKVNNKEHWVPKSQCRSFTTNQKLGGHVTLPAFILNRMFDFNIDEATSMPADIRPVWVVEHHTLEKIEPVQNNTIHQLKR